MNMAGEISNSIRMGHAARFNGLDDTGLDQLKTGRVAMPRKKNDDGPSTHSEKLKVEYDQVMYAIHRSAKRFCAPGIHSGVPELAVLLDRNFNTLESQLNPTNFDHAPTVHCFLQVIEALQSREAVEEIARLAGKHPHGRGEDVETMSTLTSEGETPPRAWGRRQGARPPHARLGNTPTGVGKTWA